MANHTRQAKRTPVTLKIKFKSATLDQFIERYSVDVSHGGIFIRTKDPLAVGTALKFEFQLRDSTPLIRGEGTVVWTREHDPSRAGVAPGMGVRFDRLPADSQEVLDKILAQKAAKGRPGGMAEQQPAEDHPFHNTPTRVAPSPLLQDLTSSSSAGASGAPIMGLSPKRDSFGDENDHRTDATPLPIPMPFHSDMDDFPDEAFEEKTRVAPMEALAKQTAGVGFLDEQGQLAAREAELQAKQQAEAEQQAKAEAEQQAKAEAEQHAKAEAEQQAKAEAEQQAKAEAEQQAKAEAEQQAKAEAEQQAKAKAEQQAKAEAKANDSDDEVAGARNRKPKATDRVSAMPVPAATDNEKHSSGVLVGLGIAAVVALGIGGYFALGSTEDHAPANRPEVAHTPTKATPDTANPGAGASTAPTPDKPPTTAPPAELPGSDATISATIQSEPTGATVSLRDHNQTGTTPHEFTGLDPAKNYLVRVAHPGYKAVEVKLIPGGKALKVKLSELPRALVIRSTPAGATIYLNGKRQAGLTPATIVLAGTLGKAQTLQVSARKAGYLNGDHKVTIASATFVPRDDKQVHEVAVDLAPRPEVAVSKPPVRDVKPDKPTGTKPDKPTGTKPDKPADAKPADTKPDKPADAKPADTKPDKPADTKPGKPADTKPDKPADTKPDKPAGDNKGDEGPVPDWMK